MKITTNNSCPHCETKTEYLRLILDNRSASYVCLECWREPTDILTKNKNVMIPKVVAELQRLILKLKKEVNMKN